MGPDQLLLTQLIPWDPEVKNWINHSMALRELQLSNISKRKARPSYPSGLIRSLDTTYIHLKILPVTIKDIYDVP